jgi:F420-non-reducing hydrogenase iron-sulfur subunit
MTNNPEKAGFEPEVVVLYCQNCITDRSNVTAESNQASGFYVRSVMMPCSSKIEVPHILRILEQGADAVEVIACPESKCRFLVGSRRAEKRIEYIRRLLDEVHIGSERLGITRSSSLSANDLMGLASGRAEAVKRLGPNPMKKG